MPLLGVEKGPEPALGAAAAPQPPCGCPHSPCALQLCPADPCPCGLQPSNSRVSFSPGVSALTASGARSPPLCAPWRPGNATCAVRAAWVRPRYHGRAQSWLRGSFVQTEAQAGGETAWAASAQPCSGCRAQLPAWVGGGRGRCEDAAPRGTSPAPGVLPCTRGTGALPSPHIDLPLFHACHLLPLQAPSFSGSRPLPSP